MSRRLPILAVLALALTRWAGAFPTLAGPTGLVALPTAQPTTERLELSGDVMDNYETRGVLVRLVAGTGGAEIGGVFVDDDADSWGVSGKIRLNAARQRVVLGVGGQYLDQQHYQVGSAYLAATGAPLKPLQCTAGVAVTALTIGDVQETAACPFVGAQLTLSRGRLITAEYRAPIARFAETRPLTSVMITRRMGNGTLYTVGITNANGLLAIREHQFFAGVTLVLGRD